MVQYRTRSNNRRQADNNPIVDSAVSFVQKKFSFQKGFKNAKHFIESPAYKKPKIAIDNADVEVKSIQEKVFNILFKQINDELNAMKNQKLSLEEELAKENIAHNSSNNYLLENVNSSNRLIDLHNDIANMKKQAADILKNASQVTGENDDDLSSLKEQVKVYDEQIIYHRDTHIGFVKKRTENFLKINMLSSWTSFLEEKISKMSNDLTNHVQQFLKPILSVFILVVDYAIASAFFIDISQDYSGVVGITLSYLLPSAITFASLYFTHKLINEGKKIKEVGALPLGEENIAHYALSSLWAVLLTVLLILMFVIRFAYSGDTAQIYEFVLWFVFVCSVILLGTITNDEKIVKGMINISFLFVVIALWPFAKFLSLFESGWKMIMRKVLIRPSTAEQQALHQVSTIIRERDVLKKKMNELLVAKKPKLSSEEKFLYDSLISRITIQESKARLLIEDQEDEIKKSREQRAKQSSKTDSIHAKLTQIKVAIEKKKSEIMAIREGSDKATLLYGIEIT